MAFDRGQHVDEAAKDVRAYRLALIGTGHRNDLVGRNTEVIRPEPNKALDEADVRGDGGFDADFGLVLNELNGQWRRLVLLSLSRFRRGSLRIGVRFHRIAVGHANNHALGLCLLLGALRQLFLRLPFSAELQKGARRLPAVGQIRRRDTPGARPFEVGQQCAARIVRDRGDRTGDRPETEPVQCECCFKSRVGRHVVVSGQLIDPAAAHRRSISLKRRAAFEFHQRWHGRGHVGRRIPISVRSRKARALLAYLAMKPDYRARREELATLFWGDNPDALARHSLRQCLISLHQDLCLASEILMVDREAIGLRAQFVSVDARRFISLARSAGPDGLTQAAELWQGAFLPDLVLDIEEFDTWHRHEVERLATAAAGVFEALCRNADANGDGERAIAAAERLVALEPTREDRQRTALKLFARHEGREAALSRAKLLTDLLRSELGVSPEAATRALIDAIKRGDFEPAHAPDLERLAVRSVAKPAGLPDAAPIALAASETKASPASIPIALTAEQAPRKTVPATLPFWHRRRFAAAWVTIVLLAIGTSVVLGVANAPKLWSPQTH